MDNAKLVRELLKQIRLGEDSKYEFKHIYIKGESIQGPSQQNLADEMAAFANQKGGYLILGVDDKTKAVNGISEEMIEKVQQMIRNAAQDNINPPLPIYTRIIELPDTEGTLKNVLYVAVDKSLFVHSSNGKYFHRVAESKKIIPHEYLSRLMMQRSQSGIIWFDESPVNGTRPDDLDESLYVKFLREKGQPESNQLRKLKMLVDDENKEPKLSVSGVLLGTQNPSEWLPHAYIQAVSYAGEGRNSNQQTDARDITGPLDQQVTGALQFVEKNMLVAARKIIGREDIPQYSLTAVFEALVNAVAHRDYAQHGSHIRLHMFSDRLTVSSPGALVNTMEVEDLIVRQAARNQLISSLLARCPINHAAIERAMMMDKRGEGVPVIIEESLALSGKHPEYRMHGEELELTVHAAGNQLPKC